MAAPFVLVPGHWLGGWAWDRVVPVLRAAGHPVTALTPPGLEPDAVDRGSVTLDDHIRSVADVVARHGPTTVLVAHSGAGKVATGVLDRDPRALARVVYVDSGPVAAGAAEPLPDGVADVALPPFDALAGSLEGLTPEDLEEFRRRAVPHPAGPVRQPLRLARPARNDVPATLVACSIPAATVAELAAGQHPMFAAVAELTALDYVELPTGHWPMWSRAEDLADALVAAAR